MIYLCLGHQPVFAAAALVVPAAGDAIEIAGHRWLVVSGDDHLAMATWVGRVW